MAKIIEAHAVISASDKSGAAFQAFANKVANVAKAGEQVKKSLGNMTGDAGKRIEELHRKLALIDNFKGLSKGLDQASLQFRRAQQEANRLKGIIDATTAPTRAMQAEYNRAALAVDRASRAFREQGVAAREARRALEGAGVPVNRLAAEQAKVTQSLNATTAAMQRQAQAGRMLNTNPWGVASVPRAGSGVPLMPRAGGVPVVPVPLGGSPEAAGAVGGGYLAYRAGHIAKASIGAAAEYDYAVRRQRAFAGLTLEEQEALLGPQARRIATDTKFSNVDVVEAQTEVARRLPAHLQTGVVIAPVIDQVKNYALATKGVDMNMSAEAVTGFLMSSGKDISTAEKAQIEAQRATNLLIRMQKIGGMSHEDLMPFVARGVSAGRIAGLSDETMGALAVGMRRNNISGDQAGTALRTIASKLVAPTQKGLAALATAGIDYDNFTTMPGGLSVDALEGKFRRDFGKSFTPAIRAELAEKLSDPDVIGNRGAFTQAVSEAVAGLFKRGRNGKIVQTDANKLAAKIGEFHKFSVESVNSEALLQALIKADPSLAVLNAFATDKHGNKLGLIGKSFDQFEADRVQLSSVPADYGSKISAEITGGLGGAVERLKGSLENLTLSVSRANEGVLSVSIDKLGNAIDVVADMPKPLMQFTTAVAGATIGLVALRSAALAGTFLGVPGSAAVGAAAGGALGWMGSVAARLFPVAAVIAAATPGVKVIGDANAKLYENVAPGEVHNEGRNRRHRYNTLLRQQALDERYRNSVVESGSPAGDGGGVMSGPRLEAVVKPDQITARAEVSGNAAITVILEASGALLGLINGARQTATVALKGSGPGSTGSSMPHTEVPNTGSAN